MKRSTALLFTSLSGVLLLSSCSFFGGTESDGMTVESSSSSIAASVMPTANVSYIGTVADAANNVYMQGTHKLIMDDGQFIMLESTDANLRLDNYLDKRVELRGSVQPTMEAGGTIMRVETVTLLTPESSSSVSADSSAASVLASSSSAVSSVKNSSSSVAAASSLAASTASAESSSSSVDASPTGVTDEKIALMAKQNYADSALWTQKYCTSHIGLCVPVHKNWYFKSFGATTASSWHVEFGMESIEELYQGPIFLNVVSGAAVTDGEIRTQGTDIVAFKNWKDGTHLELIADARLRPAVEFMLGGIETYATGE